ncbi:tryptophan halogenase family protein [Gimibacter soli]
MEGQVKRKVVIAGGGTAGWVAAAALSSQIGQLIDVTLVESDELGTVGVGEATIPTHRSYHDIIGVNEAEFMRATRATFKLGISFEHWGALGQKYIHSFGKIGVSSWMADFYHLWLEAQADGFGGDLGDYCLELRAAEAGKFAISQKPALNYAYHLDAGLYAKFLRAHCEKRGVRRIEGKIQEVRKNGENGFIDCLVMESGKEVKGDLFIDCTGFQALLIGKALGVPYEDWSHWLPMDSAIAVQTRAISVVPPYTRSIAQDAGWQWRIPLQHRVGNGHVYCSDYMSDDEARHILDHNLDGEQLFEPRLIRFRTGRRKKIWEKNCVALGLSSGFLEPLESTSIHLFQISATRLVQMFPFSGVSDSLTSFYNKLYDEELLGIRDFIILHYLATKRDDTPFWRDRQTLDIPGSLREKITLFKEHSIIHQAETDLFRADSWLQVMRGQGLHSEGYHHVGKLMKPEVLRANMEGYAARVKEFVSKLPRHEDFVAQYCSADA